MSFELVKEAIKVNQVVGEQSTQTVLENDIIVPDVKPDVGRILLLDGDILVKNTETSQDKVFINGSLLFKILYISDEPTPSIKSIASSAGFSYELDVPNTRSNMNCKVKCDIEHIDYNILNGRKINTKAIVKLSGRVINTLDQDIVNDLSGEEDIQSLKDRVSINCALGNGEVSYTAKESLDVPAGKPAIREILRSDIKITGKDYKVTEGKIIARGELNISTLYSSDDESQGIQYMEHEIPFTQFIDLPGINEDSGCELSYRIIDSQFEPVEDSDGELRILSGEVTVNIEASGYAKRSIEMISDAYSPRAKLVLDKEPFKFEDIVTESKSQIVLKDTIAIPEGSPEIAEVMNVICKPGISDYAITDGKLVLEGAVTDSILYLANSAEQPVYSSRQEVLFKHGIDIKGIKSDMKCDIDLDVEHCTYSMVSSNEVEVRLVIGANVKVKSLFSVPLIMKASAMPVDEKRAGQRPSILIYFSQPGDTLWKIAKKYYVTMNDIKRVNNITESEAINPGQQIFIPGKHA